MIQLGDVEYKDGNGGTSSFKKKYFADENFDVSDKGTILREQLV